MDLQLGLVPVVDDDRTHLALGEVGRSLAEATGRRCEVVRLASPEALRRAFAVGTVNLVWSSPTLALSAPELVRGEPLVTCVRQGVDHYHGVLFVRRDSAIRSVLDLEGRSMAWVAPTSAAGYIFPRVSLAGHGLDPSTLFREERFLETHGGVVLSVVENAVEAGATFAVFEDGDALRPMIRAGFVDLGFEDEVRVLLSTPAIPSDLFVASSALAAETGGTLVDALDAVTNDVPESFRQVFGAEAVAPTRMRTLAELRRQLDDARAMGILD